jgi:hypothetical protein
LGSTGSRIDPLSLDGFLAFALRERWPLVVAAIGGALWAMLLRPRSDGGDVSAVASFTEPPDRAAAIGALGEALVAGRLGDLGYPILRNVILRSRFGSAEMDFLVRVPDGVVVLEIKTWSGRVAGTAESANWVRISSRGRSDAMPNAVTQNLGHVAAVERYLGDRRVRVRGYVVSCGRAAFSLELIRFVVPLDDLCRVLDGESRETAANEAAIARAWARLGAEARKIAGRRSAHVARVRAIKAGVLRWR